MDLAALALWAGTACVGLYLMGDWLSRGGISGQPAKVTRYPAFVIVSHPVIALGGLALWVGYMVSGQMVYCWVALGALSASALLGFALFTRWLTGLGGRHARVQRERLGSWPMLLHGVAGLATFFLILVTATAMTQS